MLEESSCDRQLGKIMEIVRNAISSIARVDACVDRGGMADSVGWSTVTESAVGSIEGLEGVGSIIETASAARDWARVWTRRAVSSATMLSSCASLI